MKYMVPNLSLQGQVLTVLKLVVPAIAYQGWGWHCTPVYVLFFFTLVQSLETSSSLDPGYPRVLCNLK